MRILAISLVLCAMFACGKKHVDTNAVQVSQGRFEVPLVASKDPEVFRPVPGEDLKNLEAVITVNASAEKPITAPIKIRIFDEPKKGILAKIRPSNEPKHAIFTESSDTLAAQNIEAEQPEVSVWWWWAGVAFFSLIFVLFVALLIYSKLKKITPLGAFKSIVSRFF